MIYVLLVITCDTTHRHLTRQNSTLFSVYRITIDLPADGAWDAIAYATAAAPRRTNRARAPLASQHQQMLH